MELFYACNVLFCGGGMKKNVFFPAQKAQDVCWEVVACLLFFLWENMTDMYFLTC
jgi:hypothetical protein